MAQFQQIPREENTEANILAKAASADELVVIRLKSNTSQV